MQGIAELIEEFCECTEGYYFRPDYSGRFMYGRKCIGIVTDKGVAVAMGELYEFLHTRDRNIVYCHTFVPCSRGTHYLPFTYNKGTWLSSY